jgi:signal transduction histidine kinase
MILPEKPKNEAKRIAALKSYNILNSVPEEDFDQITSLASAICNTPISLVTLIDFDKNIFKSKCGLKFEEVPRELSFCAHAINKPSEMMVVNDARKDERFFDNPFVTGSENVTFYAGVPLINKDGFALGTLCIIDVKPKELSNIQLQALKTLANQTMNLIELRKANFVLHEKQKELENLNKELETFTYWVSHDLKGPLRIIKTFLELIEKKSDYKIEEPIKQYIKYAIDGTDKMKNLIDDLLEYSRLNKKSEMFEIVNLNNVVEEVEKLLISPENLNNVKINYHNLPFIYGSPTGLKVLMLNLISNALKFRKDDENAEINIEAKELDTKWQISVSDNGIGIEEKNINFIFDLFKKIHTKENHDGNGIGLAICKKIIHQHHAEIQVKTELGVGSTFILTFPKKVFKKEFHLEKLES